MKNYYYIKEMEVIKEKIIYKWHRSYFILFEPDATACFAMVVHKINWIKVDFVFKIFLNQKTEFKYFCIIFKALRHRK